MNTVMTTRSKVLCLSMISIVGARSVELIPLEELYAAPATSSVTCSIAATNLRLDYESFAIAANLFCERPFAFEDTNEISAEINNDTVLRIEKPEGIAANVTTAACQDGLFHAWAICEQKGGSVVDLRTGVTYSISAGSSSSESTAAAATAAFSTTKDSPHQVSIHSTDLRKRDGSGKRRTLAVRENTGPWASTDCFTDGEMHYTLPSFQTSVNAFCASANGDFVQDADQSTTEYLYCYNNAMVVSLRVSPTRQAVQTDR
ncbi:hypothetical protein EJ03DRAFT_200790 [Teratosphaeria nubilosa]|uniref:AA1-like domain-containing protein n=1 Tax=Teratosphaeria nubilosa TaxID=161662 RepID=A0A6G1LHA9_9PEZI|nr:hypothetical protein EJ03DRAFT_200790 [Teratosphaeria nubilosa]